MYTFTDKLGQDWLVEVTIGTVKRIKAMIDVDLLDLEDGRVIERISSDPCLLADVLYCVCKPQADERSINDEQFGARLGGDSIEKATDALLDALVAFFPSRKRTILSKALAKVRAIETRVLDMATTQIDSPEVAAQIETALGGLGRMYGGSLPLPESPAASLTA